MKHFTSHDKTMGVGLLIWSLAAVLYMTVFSCKQTREFLNQPDPANQSGQYTWNLSDGQVVTLNLPGLPNEPIQHTLPDGTVVTLDPSSAQPPSTMGGRIATSLGGLIGALTMNPILGMAVASGGKLLMDRFAKPQVAVA